MASVLARLVRMDELTEPDVLLIEHAYLDDLCEGRFDTVMVPRRAYGRAREWLLGQEANLWTLDALHLGVCRELDVVFVTCDRRLHAAAAKVGLRSELIS